MKVFQFQWRGLVNDLVIDIEEETRGRAVIKLQNLIEDWRSSDDPTVLDLSEPRVYARAWINLNPLDVGFDNIIDEWESTSG